MAVDLYYDIVRSKMEWPTRDLSIKTLATFLGFEWRDQEPSGAASIEWYHRWVETEDLQIRRNRTANHTPHALKNARGSVLSNHFPPQSGIVLTFENPPDVVGAVSHFVYKIPASIEEGDGGLHFSGRFACATGTRWLT